MSNFVKTIIWIVTEQAGLHPRRIVRTLIGLPRYISDWRMFRKQYRGDMRHMPCLHDWNDTAGSVSSEYFGQDLYVAQKIFRLTPESHVDIGSRIDGFVAHVASFRTIEVIDIRPIETEIPNVVFKKADFTIEAEGLSGYCDSLSCLHALEHFGLGRYGDPISAYGFSSGLRNLSRMLKRDGLLYLSVPIGKECVMFNAHRISNPILLVAMARENDLELEAFAYWDRDRMNEVGEIESALTRISELDYALGVFTFRRQ